MEGRPPFVSDICEALSTVGAASALDQLAAASALFVNMSAPFDEVRGEVRGEVRWEGKED